MTDQSIKEKSEQITNILANKLFKVTFVSAPSSVIAACIVIYAQWNIKNWQPLLYWAMGIIVISITRFMVARLGTESFHRGENPVLYLNTQAILSGLLGLGWVSAMFIFDNGSIDENLSIRLMMILGALGITVTSMAILKRIFIPYISTIVIPMLFFLITHEYLHQWNVLLPSFLIFSGLVVMISIRTFQQNYIAASDQVQIIALTKQLQEALVVEKELRYELDIRADTDELTGILNRRGLMKQLHLEVARCRRLSRTVAVLMIDIDYFKKVNDTYGHTNGDLVLLRTVETIKTQLRDADVFGRFGGEEFLLILPEMGEEGTLSAAERIRQAVENSEIEFEHSAIKISISIGVAIFSRDDEINDLIVRADHALYAAKNNGRNRVEIDLDVHLEEVEA
jgi:diguanylate cyclase (GGDEF)-like protein